MRALSRIARREGSRLVFEDLTLITVHICQTTGRKGLEPSSIRDRDKAKYLSNSHIICFVQHTLLPGSCKLLRNALARHNRYLYFTSPPLSTRSYFHLRLLSFDVIPTNIISL
jgi:hypothetical protein